MAKQKRIADGDGDGDGECPLPPELVHHIHSLMDRKEAARSTILSKSWYNFWSKRPILDLDQRDFRHLGAPYFCSEIVGKYDRSDDFYLKIQTFKLWMEPYHYHQPLATESMAKAMKLGASRLNLELRTPLPSLDDGDVPGSETLARLSVTGCAIDLGKNGEVTCSKLKPLCSGLINIKCDNSGAYVFSAYPLLMVLKFSGRLEYEFHKLESLTLDNLRVIDTLFFQDLFSKFPCLRNLKLQYVYDCKNILIRSRSLESVSVVEYNRAVTMEFDVPNLRKFHFVGSALSCLAFGPTCSSRDWESDIGIMCYQASASWLSSLRKLLSNFSLSKVSLSIHVKFPSKYICDYTTTANEHVPGVERLNFMDHSPNAGLLDGLLMICRPKNCVVPGNYDVLKLLCKKFENKCVRGLEEVNVECLEVSLTEWQPVPLKTVLLDVSANPENAHAFRFRLRYMGNVDLCTLTVFLINE